MEKLKMKPEALQKIGYGMYVVCSKKEGKFNGQIANAVIQVTAEPPLIAVSINKNNLTHEFIEAGRVFTVSILVKDTPLKFIGDFGFRSGREADKFREKNYKVGVTGVPVVLDNALGYIEAEVVNSLSVETHTIFVGKVVGAEILGEEEPMTYAYYHDVKRGTSPKNAPTYVKKEEKGDAGKMQKYICKVCGYIYDPAPGDPDSGVKPGTSFEELPGNWVCPVCGAGKDQFEKTQ